MHSIWEESRRAGSFPALEGDVNTDVLIVGGGICGLLCAYMLHQAGIDYILVEADRICSGITKNTTAKLTWQHGLIYHKLIKQQGVDRARLYLQANREALEEFAVLCRKLDCDFERRDSFVYSLGSDEKLRREFQALRALGEQPRLCRRTQLPFPVAGAVEVEDQAQLHPLRFCAGLSQGLRIYEHTKVRELAEGRAVTDRATVRARRIVIATHFPLLNKHGAYFLKLYQHRSYVLALENAPRLAGMYVDEAMAGLSFREYENMLLVGGGGHRTGKPGGGWEELRGFARRWYPNATEVAHWATQDCMSLDGIPYIGRYSPGTQGLYVATGFNKWGMTSSMAAALLLRDLLQGKENPYTCLFDPARSMLRPQLGLNAWEATVNLLTPAARRCPHLGCALKWNPQEHTWDCPCHGSRFSQDGRLIDNPATDDLKSQKEH